MHWCLNAVTEPQDYPAAVLIRALEPIAGFATMRKRRGKEPLCSGPARLCEALGVTGALNGVSLQRGLLRIVQGTPPKRNGIAISPRIGITQAADWPLRFYLKDSPYVSRG
jgi:DNA-3-methyladenine glycosylase